MDRALILQIDDAFFSKVVTLIKKDAMVCASSFRL